jgi:hypothetical protein
MTHGKGWRATKCGPGETSSDLFNPPRLHHRYRDDRLNSTPQRHRPRRNGSHLTSREGRSGTAP